jgi:hypothetical protein
MSEVCTQETVDVDSLSDGALASALLAGAERSGWAQGAAVELVVSEGSWLSRSELRAAVEAWDDGELCALIDWDQVRLDGPASAGELRILELARSLAGVAGSRPLCDLVSGLDERNLTRVLLSVWLAARGLRGCPSWLLETGGSLTC